MFLIYLHLALVTCEEFSNNDNIVVGNLKRREQIPLSQINRRFSGNLNYRKTKDIRDEGTDRRKEEIDTNRGEVIFDRQRDDVIIYDKKDTFDKKRDDYYNQKRVKILDMKKRDDVFERNRDEAIPRNREEIIDWKRDEPYFRSWEEFWDRRDDGFDRKREEIDEQRYVNKKRDELWDRRFEQSEREANRLEDTNEKQQSLHQDLRWLTVNTDEGIGIGI